MFKNILTLFFYFIGLLSFSQNNEITHNLPKTNCDKIKFRLIKSEGNLNKNNELNFLPNHINVIVEGRSKSEEDFAKKINNQLDNYINKFISEKFNNNQVYQSTVNSKYEKKIDELIAGLHHSNFNRKKYYPKKFLSNSSKRYHFVIGVMTFLRKNSKTTHYNLIVFDRNVKEAIYHKYIIVDNCDIRNYDKHKIILDLLTSDL